MVDTDIVLYRASTNISKSHGLTLHQKWLQKFQQTKFFIMR